MRDGYDCQISDAECAYLQVRQKGVKTWVRLPRWLWPKSWYKLKRPVVQMLINLYGHPKAGDHWWYHLEDKVLLDGWERIGEGWISVYFHPKWKCVLVVYVDDLKISGPKAILPTVWGSLGKHVRLGPPQSWGRFLGVHLTLVVRGTVYTLIYDMRVFMQSCLDRYVEVCGTQVRFVKVQTPFLDESYLTEEECTEVGYLAEFRRHQHQSLMWRPTEHIEHESSDHYARHT